jgi:hypothetical protein
VESAASYGKIKDFPTVCLENSFGVSHTSHNPDGCFSIYSLKRQKCIDANLPLLYSGEEKREWFLKW